MVRTRSIARLSVAVLIWIGSIAAATVTSALINKQLDTVQNFNFDATLPEVITQIGNQTGVRIEADPAVYDLLPWGEQTNISAKIQNATLRQSLTSITQKLGLQFALADEAVSLKPMPALQRLGKRATVDELGVLDLMTEQPLYAVGKPGNLAPTLVELLKVVDDRLQALGSTFAVDNRSDASLQQTHINLARNASIADALEAMTQQLNAAWYPWGKTILVVPKQQQIRTQLGKLITTRYNDVDVAQVILELSQKAGVDFNVDPGSYQRIPPQYRKIQLILEDATVQETLDSIGGYTGLGFEVTEKGVHVWNAYLPGSPDATAAPSTRPAR